jgi:hypothetical protein
MATAPLASLVAQVLWRENAERLISQWRPNIILEAW